MKFFYSLLFSLLFAASAFAQNQRFIHQAFPLDTATILELDLYGEYSIETWVGDAVMVETQVSVFNAAEGIFNHYIKEGRYVVEAKLEGETLSLVSKDKTRSPIKTPKKDSIEKITMKVFIPDVMKPAGDKRWERPKEEKK